MFLLWGREWSLKITQEKKLTVFQVIAALKAILNRTDYRFMAKLKRKKYPRCLAQDSRHFLIMSFAAM